jgi:metal-responsive CopG/Arc/MetJ family transcriptional regulator
MKTEISIDDKLFNDAENFSKAAGLSRSDLYCIALREYIQNHSSDTVKGDLKNHYREHDSQIDDDLKAAADRLLPGKIGK